MNTDQPDYDIADYLRNALPTFPLLEDNRANVNDDHENASAEDYASVGDSLYYSARTTFLQYHGIISLFLGQQAIENYLKGLLKHLGVVPMQRTHNLERLLQTIQAHTTEAFFHSDECLAIIRFFNPFNELPRYPVHMSRPENGGYGYIHPDAIYFLDFFVQKYREYYPVPLGKWNLFEKGYPFTIEAVRDNADSETRRLFKLNNLNYQKS